jgi:hypothetical protein
MPLHFSTHDLIWNVIRCDLWYILQAIWFTTKFLTHDMICDILHFELVMFCKRYVLQLSFGTWYDMWHYTFWTCTVSQAICFCNKLLTHDMICDILHFELVMFCKRYVLQQSFWRMIWYETLYIVNLWCFVSDMFYICLIYDECAIIQRE